jgi:hypothetical protein
MKPSMKSTLRRSNVSLAIVIVIAGLASCLAAYATEPLLCRQESPCCPSTWCEGCCQPICCCPDDYCPKEKPCVPCLRGPWCCDDYCRKSLPCLPCTPLGRCCDDYCDKPCPACPPRLCAAVNRCSAAGASRNTQINSPSTGPREWSTTRRPLLFPPNSSGAMNSLLPIPSLHVPALTVEIPSPTDASQSTARLPALLGPLR